jgi:hypothetical protein
MRLAIDRFVPIVRFLPGLSDLEKTEYEGSWWLPEKPEEQVNGLLRCEADGQITLTLVGKLIASEGPPPRQSH